MEWTMYQKWIMPPGDTTIKKVHLVTYPMDQVPRVVWKKSPAPELAPVFFKFLLNNLGNK